MTTQAKPADPGTAKDPSKGSNWLPGQAPPEFKQVDAGDRGRVPPGFSPVATGSEAIQQAIRAGRAKNSAEYVKKLSGYTNLLAGVKAGTPGAYRNLQNVVASFTTDDFSYFFVDILNFSIVAQWRSRPSPFRDYFARKTLTDFRQGKIFQFNWDKDSGAGELPMTREQELPRYYFGEDGVTTMQIEEYKAATMFDWRTMVNDNLDALMQLPQMINNLILWTEGVLKTRMYASASGPNTSFFTTANNNLLVANGTFGVVAHNKLTISALQAAVTQMKKQKGPVGEDLGITGTYLVVSDGQDIIADTLFDSMGAIAETAGGAGGSGDQLERVRITAPSGMQKRMDPYLKNVITSGTIADTCWMIVADPAMSRPAFYYADFMPQPVPYMLRKLPQYEQIGGMGGAMAETEYVFGFFTDEITYEPRMALWSNGTG